MPAGLLIMALLDSLYKANEIGLPTESEDADFNIGKSLVGKLDMTRIGMMGHSRGGDAVSSFVQWNRVRPSGRRYPLRAVISLAPVNYERSATYGVPFMVILPWCDGDVSNLQGARIFERGQHVNGDNPYPMVQSSQLGGNHNWYNSVWFADADISTGSGDDSSSTDKACGSPGAGNNSDTSIRLSGEAGTDSSENYAIDNSDKLDPTMNTRISGDPARMGDQEKIGLATMSAFFRRYVGGEGAFEPYLTGELNEEGKPQIPASACPTSKSGKNMPCIERVSDNYFAPSSERLDVIDPETENPLAMSSLGTKLRSSGFSNPYVEGQGVSPVPPTTASGLDWCNPEPDQTTPSQLGISGLPTAERPCPLPEAAGVGGQAGGGLSPEGGSLAATRENAPVNNSFGLQLAVAWDDPVASNGSPAKLGTSIPAADKNVSGYKVLAMSADVNFFDPRNPERSVAATSDPSLTTQDFTIALTDSEGHEGTVSAADQRYGNALHQSTGNISTRVHVILDQIRVPLADFAKQGVDLTKVSDLEFRFGEAGKPKSGSIELADVRFQEAVGGTDVLLDSTEPYAGPGEGEPTEGPNPVAEIKEFDRTAVGLELPDVTTEAGANVWTVDDDKAQCPNAEFTKIQDAVDQAAPWDTVVVCDGLYEESSTPVNASRNPVEAGAMNGLTITKPLKLKGAGADKVTIRPAASLGSSLAGTAPYLRDGGGNVITVSRQSFGSTDDPELYVDISGVTVDSPNAYAEAGIAFFNTAGRVSNSVVGPLTVATTEGELAEHPHGWGIVVTNHLIGSGPGTALRRVTVTDSKVYGYQTGGILFDDASGADGAPANTEAAGIKINGYVNDTIVEGLGATTVVPQTGIQYHAGAAGFIQNSSISGNLFTPEQRKSVGILLTGAETSGWYTSGSLLKGNGYGLFNADITNTAVRGAAPALATGNFWGDGGSPVTGPTVLGPPEQEGVSGLDAEATPKASVTFSGALSSVPNVPGPGPMPDSAPSGSVVNPGDGEEVEVGKAAVPVVLADDDFGVKSVSLTADGVPLATLGGSPYVFDWAPTADEAGKTVTLEATITDSAGQSTTSTIEVPVAAPVEPPVVTPPAPPAAEQPVPPVRIKLAKQKRVLGAGTLFLRVHVPAKGRLVLNGKGVRRVTRQPKVARSLWVPIRSKGKALATLDKKGKVKLKIKLVFTPAGGTTLKMTKVVVLKKK